MRYNIEKLPKFPAVMTSENSKNKFALTIAFAIAISTFNALTFSPMLSALLLARESEPPSRRTYAISGVFIGFVYGLLASGGGTLVALGMLALATGVGFGLLLLTGLPLRLPFAIGGAVSALLLAGVNSQLAVLIYTLIGGALGWGAPFIFRRFNVIYAGV